MREAINLPAMGINKMAIMMVAGSSRKDRLKYKAGRGKEKRNEQPICNATHTGHELLAQPVGQPRQGGSEQERPQGTMQPDAFASHNHQEKGAHQQSKEKLGHVQEAPQQGHGPGKHPGRYDPDQDSEACYLTQQLQYSEEDSVCVRHLHLW